MLENGILLKLYALIIGLIVFLLLLCDFNRKKKSKNSNKIDLIPNIHIQIKSLKEEKNEVNIPKYEKKFPKNARLRLADFIFKLLKTKKKYNENLILELILLRFEIYDYSFQRKIGLKSFRKIKANLLDNFRRIGVVNYLLDLIRIIHGLSMIKEKNFELKQYTSQLYKQNITLGLTRYSLEYNVAEIFDFLKKSNKDFYLKRLKKKNLYNKDGYKECSFCGEIKAHSEFSKIRNRLRSVCKNCFSIKKSINNFRKKLFVFNTISDYEIVECSRCQTSIESLPALEIHHENKHHKLVSWRDIQNKAKKDILNILCNEEIIILCTNCHLVVQAIIYKKYQNLIMNDLFLLMSEDVIKNLVYNYYKNSSSDYDASIKRQIIYWIKKWLILCKVYDGKCIGCQKTLNDLELPSLEFHHISQEDKEEFKWDNVCNLSLKEITFLLKNEKCISLCANCHQLIHSPNFYNYIEEIFNSNKIVNKFQKDFKEIVNNINNFTFKRVKENYIFNSENWLSKSKLCILSLFGDGNNYTINEICQILDYKRTFCYERLKDLTERKFLKRTQKREYKYSITEEGKKILVFYNNYEDKLSFFNYFDFGA